MTTPYIVNVTGKGFVALMQTSNTIVGGWLGIGYLILLFSLALSINKNYRTSRGIMGASFFVMIISVLLRMMQILDDRIMFATFAIFILSIVWVKLSD